MLDQLVHALLREGRWMAVLCILSVALAGLISLTLSQKYAPYIELFSTWKRLGKVRIVIVSALLASFLSYYVAARILLYQSFQLPVYDFGLFVQMLWKVAYFQSPDMLFNHQPHWLGDHFQPIFYVLVPFARIVNPAIVLLLIEPVALVAGAGLLISLTYRKTRSIWLALALAFTYMFVYGTYFSQFYPFHPSTLVGPLMLWMFWSIENRKWTQYWIALILALMCKENVGFYTGCYGLWLAVFASKKVRIAGVLTAILSFGWSWLALSVFIPHFKQAPFSTIYGFNPRLYTEEGSVAKTLFRHPELLWQVGGDTPIKLQGLLASVLSFSYLPLFFIYFFPLLPLLAERYLSSNQNHWSLFFHYAAPTMAILSYMTLGGFQVLLWLANWLGARFKKVFLRYQPTVFGQVLAFEMAALLVGGTLVANSILGIRFINFQELAQQARSEEVTNRREATARIPDAASVLAQDSLATSLATRNKVMLLDGSDPEGFEYVLIDLSLPSWPIQLSYVTESYLAKLQADPSWGIVYSKGTVVLFGKGKESTATLTPQLEAQLPAKDLVN